LQIIDGAEAVGLPMIGRIPGNAQLAGIAYRWTGQLSDRAAKPLWALISRPMQIHSVEPNNPL
jgi:hypothetical protein